MHRDLRAPADAVQQVRHATLGVPDVKQPTDQCGDPRQRPPLILGPAMRGRTGVQLGLQPGQPGRIQPTGRTAGALGPQPVAPVPPPGPLPLVGRLGRHPQPPGDLPGRHPLLKQVHSLHPYHLAASPPPRVQAAAIGVPHTLRSRPPHRHCHGDTPSGHRHSPRPFGLSTAPCIGPRPSKPAMPVAAGPVHADRHHGRRHSQTA